MKQDILFKKWYRRKKFMNDTNVFLEFIIIILESIHSLFFILLQFNFSAGHVVGTAAYMLKGRRVPFGVSWSCFISITPCASYAIGVREIETLHF